MRYIKALEIGCCALETLCSQTRGTVHSTFEHALNLRFQDKLVGVLTSRSILNPISLIANIDTFKTIGIAAGSDVKIRNKKITLSGHIAIDFSQAIIWKPKTGVTELDLKKFHIGYRALQDFIKNTKKSGLLSLYPSLVEGEKLNTSDPFLARAFEAILRLVQKIENGEKPDERDTGNLIGLGPGLTPSGDDFLCGLGCSLVWIANTTRASCPGLSSLKKSVDRCSSRTTLLSSQLLKQSFQGQANKAVEELLESVFAGDPPSVERSARRVLELGETSGSDLMLGLVLGLKAGKKILPSHFRQNS